MKCVGTGDFLSICALYMMQVKNKILTWRFGNPLNVIMSHVILAYLELMSLISFMLVYVLRLTIRLIFILLDTINFLLGEQGI
jgi:hypothetical protein